MLEIASEITICLLIAAFIGFAIGYIFAKNTKKVSKEIENEVENEVSAEENTKITLPDIATKEAIEVLEALEAQDEAPKEIEAIKPEVLDAPLQDKPKDKLSTIKGIGHKLEETLNRQGIFYFYQIASWEDSHIKWLEINTTFAHRTKKDLWVRQAKALIA